MISMRTRNHELMWADLEEFIDLNLMKSSVLITESHREEEGGERSRQTTPTDRDGIEGGEKTVLAGAVTS